jgi:hypothetical protein
MNAPADELVPFGIHADTGRPLSSLSEAAIRANFQREREPSPELLSQQARAGSGAAFAALDGIETDDLTQAGWGVIFAPGLEQKIKDALQPLLDHRKAQGAAPFVIYDQDGYRPGETTRAWLKRRNVSLNVVDPSLGVPFYLLIVAPPDAISFEFQYTLDLYWGVGRIWFDTADEFRAYADSVVAYEKAAAPLTSRQLALFAPQHDLDAATQLFTRQVAVPLRDGMGTSTLPIGQRQRYARRDFFGEAASKENLTRIFRGDIAGGRPALLFSGGHGMAFSPEDAQFLSCQGALVCQDWPGSNKITADHWFAGADVPADAKVHGLIHFMFACYGGGAPELDNFDRFNDKPRRIAPRAFFSRLPQALLAHRDGGALAVLAHIERAWAFSFQNDKGGAQTQGFRDVIGRLLRGQRIGAATDTFNLRWAALSTQLAEAHVDLMHDPNMDVAQLGILWVARDDARNFMILGDPAVRLREAEMPEIV